MSPQCAEACETLHRDCRGSVHVFLLNGFDPFGATRVGDLKASLHRLGFNKVYGGQFYHAGSFADEIRALAAADANAHFVVVGVGAGVEAASSLAESVSEHGIAVDTLVSIDSPFWSRAPTRHPANVRRVLHLHGRLLGPSPAESAGEDIELPVESWFGVASHSLTVERLAEELAAIGTTIPRSVTTEPPPPGDADLTPRPFAQRPQRPGDAWEFLKPVTRLGETAGPAAVRRNPPTP